MATLLAYDAGGLAVGPGLLAAGLSSGPNISSARAATAQAELNYESND